MTKEQAKQLFMEQAAKVFENEGRPEEDYEAFMEELGDTFDTYADEAEEQEGLGYWDSILGGPLNDNFAEDLYNDVQLYIQLVEAVNE